MNTDWAELSRIGKQLGMADEIGQFQKAAARDLCSVAFLGEFSRGKSTLVNSLIGRSLLPVDVRPTTAGVVALTHGTEASARFHRPSGVVDVEPNGAALRNIQTLETGGTGNDEAGWMEISLPFPPALRRLRLLDTPGVNDLTETSPEVVYRLLPHVDLVVYVLDASDSVHASEQAFIRAQSRSVPDVPAVVFVNKMDRLDADDPEELREVEEDVRARLASVLGPECPVLFGSARALTDELSEILDARVEQALTRRRNRQWSLAQRLVIDRVRTETALLDTEEREGGAALERLVEMGPALREGMEAFRKHTRSVGEHALAEMVARSLQAWRREAERDLVGQIRMAGNLTAFAEIGLERAIERLARGWVDAHAGHIRQFLARHANATAAEAARAFAVDGLHLTSDAVFFAMVPYNQPGSIELREGAEMSIAARYGIAAAGSILAGLIATPLSVIGFAAGLAVAENLKKQRDSAIQDQLEGMVPEIVQRAADGLARELLLRSGQYFDMVDGALDRALRQRLQRVEREATELRRSGVERAPQRLRRRKLLSEFEVVLHGP